MTFVSKRPWTPEEDQVVKKLYTDVEVSKIAEQLGRTHDAVLYHINQLYKHNVLDHGKKHRRPWTRHEDLYILDRYPYDTVMEIGKVLHRGHGSVVNRANFLRAGDNLAGVLTQKGVCQIMGVHLRTVHEWIRKGLIKADRKNHQYFSVDRDSLERFIEKYPWEYDAERTDIDSFIGRLARKVAKERVYYTVAQAARAKFVSDTSVRMAVYRGDLPCERTTTGSMRISKEALGAWVVNF